MSEVKISASVWQFSVIGEAVSMYTAAFSPQKQQQKGDLCKNGWTERDPAWEQAYT